MSRTHETTPLLSDEREEDEEVHQKLTPITPLPKLQLGSELCGPVNQIECSHSTSHNMLEACRANCIRTNPPLHQRIPGLFTRHR